jgi:hypothetical protein
MIFFYSVLLYRVYFSNMGVRISQNGALGKSIQNHYLVGKMGIYECGCVKAAVKTSVFYMHTNKCSFAILYVSFINQYFVCRTNPMLSFDM